MLNLWLWEPTDGSSYVHSAGLIFEAEYESEWLESDLIKAMIKDVDKSTVISGEAIQSPVLGMIPPTSLSVGVKTLILAANDDSRIYNLTSCGDNCAKWILKLTENQDITMRLGHYMKFDNIEGFQIRILNTGEVVTSYLDLVDRMVQCAR